ncbi:beta-lactamase/transpeptidase-like protein [Nemania sp. NC0429]|nr:beta-lactamase/transpeptidase-like protein [Nemania sp. NC0429]
MTEPAIEKLASLDSLQSPSPQITELMKIAGIADLSLGVYRPGEPIHYANFGYRDVASKLHVTEQMISASCSLTKLFTAQSMAHIMTITDVLSHRTGMSDGNVIFGSENNFIIGHEDSVKFLNDQVPIGPFRGQIRYNNLGYNIAGLVVDKVACSWADTFRRKLFQPLGMGRTFTGRPPLDTENVAKAYNTLDDSTPVEIPLVKAGEAVFAGSSGGIFTCMVKAINCRFGSGQSPTNSPFKRVEDIVSAKVPMNQPTILESSYAFGIARTQLPGSMGHIGSNPELMPDGKMSIVAKGTLSRLGCLPGALSAIAMIPELEIVVVVIMSNSFALNDCPDLVLQLALEHLLHAPHRNDYVALVRQSVNHTLQWYDKTLKSLRDEGKSGTSSRDLEMYVEVAIHDGKLYWALQGLDSGEFGLGHFGGDTFLWVRSQNFMVRRGRCDFNPVSSFLVLSLKAAKSHNVVSIYYY